MLSFLQDATGATKLLSEYGWIAISVFLALGIFGLWRYYEYRLRKERDKLEQMYIKQLEDKQRRLELLEERYLRLNGGKQ